MAEKYLSTTGLTKLVEEMSSLTSSALNGMYGSIMGQCLKRSDLNNGLEFGTSPNTEGYDGDPYLKLSADVITGVSNEINIDTNGQSVFLGSSSVDTAYLSMNTGDTTLYSGGSTTISAEYYGGMDGHGVSSISVGDGIDISSGANLNISAKDYSDADSGYDYGNINIESKKTTIQGVFSANNGKYSHMPNNESMLDLDEYKSDHYKFVSSNLSNTDAYTSTLIPTVVSASTSTVFKSTTKESAVYSYTMTDAVNFYKGTSLSDKDPKWIINPISNETTDLYNRTLIIPGPRVTLRYTSGAAASANGNTLPTVSTRLSSLTCTYKAKVYREATLIGTKELGTTASINQVVLQTLASGTSKALAVPDLQIDFSEQEWLEWIRTKDATFTLKNWKDNISIVIVGDINLARPSGYWASTVVDGFEYSISYSLTAVSYPASNHTQPIPFYEGSQDGIRQYFNDANYFSMIPDQSTELYTPKFSISGNTYAAAFYETSDEKLKDFSNEITVDFDKLKEIRKSYFTWKDGDGKMQIGTSAQDVQKVYPELVSENKDGNLTVDYAKLSLVALAAVDKLEERLAKIEKMLNITE